jgi:hypothetical protein
LGLAYLRLYPEKSSQSLAEWINFWSLLAEEFFSNNLSVGVFDLEENEELVGTFLSKNLNIFPEDFA